VVEVVVGFVVVLVDLVLRAEAVEVVVVAVVLVERRLFSVELPQRHTELVVVEVVWIMEVQHKGLREVMVLVVS
jgi:hypothetical protein